LGASRMKTSAGKARTKEICGRVKKGGKRTKTQGRLELEKSLGVGKGF